MVELVKRAKKSYRPKAKRTYKKKAKKADRSIANAKRFSRFLAEEGEKESNQ